MQPPLCLLCRWWVLLPALRRGQIPASSSSRWEKRLPRSVDLTWGGCRQQPWCGAKECPTSLYMRSSRGTVGANELSVPGLLLRPRHLAAGGILRRCLQANLPAPGCDALYCAAGAKFLSSERRGWAAAVVLVPSAWWCWHCLGILSSWPLPGSHVAFGFQRFVIAGPGSMGTFSGFFPAAGVCCGCLLRGRVLPAPLLPLPATPKFLPHPGRARGCRAPAPLPPPVPSWLCPGHLQPGGCGERNLLLFWKLADLTPRGKILSCQSLSVWR